LEDVHLQSTTRAVGSRVLENPGMPWKRWRKGEKSVLKKEGKNNAEEKRKKRSVKGKEKGKKRMRSYLFKRTDFSNFGEASREPSVALRVKSAERVR
jgi:hypothetical protein